MAKPEILSSTPPRVAFLITAHDQPRLVARLAGRLAPFGDVYIHLDAKVDIAPFAALVGNKATFTRTRHRVSWAGYSIVKALLTLIAEAKSNGPYDYYSAHSGRDYPIRPLEELIPFLQQGRGQEYINLNPLPERNKVRVEHYHLINYVDPHRAPRWVQYLATQAYFFSRRFLSKRKMPDGWQPYIGPNWFVLSRKLAHGFLEYMEQNRSAARFFTFCFTPDEIAVHSYAANNGFLPLVSPTGYLHHIIWRRGANHPRTLTERDFPALAASKKFFARKFSEDNMAVLDMLDAHMDAASALLPSVGVKKPLPLSRIP